jgi:transketolase C-terminal domain/subunit
MAEQNLVAVAAGLARTGTVPFATTYGVFATAAPTTSSPSPSPTATST